MDTKYIYVVVRTDIPVAAQIVQASHAAFEAGARFGHDGTPPNLVLLQVIDEDALLKVRDRLASEADIGFEVFYEPDFDTGYTALATEPIFGAERRFFKKMKMWSFKNS